MFGSFNNSPFLCGMEINITTEIVKDETSWKVIIKEAGEYITTTYVRTKTQANQLCKSKKRLMEQIELAKIFIENGIDLELPF